MHSAPTKEGSAPAGRGALAAPALTLLFLSFATGCGSPDATTTPPPPPPAYGQAAQLLLLDGDDQDGAIGDLLPAEVRFRVVDASGRPVPGVTVQLRVTAGGGTVPSASINSDSTGAIHTPWTLGPTPGYHALTAVAATLPEVVVTATASACDLINCADDHVGQDTDDWKVLDLATYEGSGQTTHPDISRGGPGMKWLWLAVTPYPGSDITKENPSLYQSLNGRFWRVPRGLANPVALPTLGYLSDPDMTFDDASHQLWMYYRQVTGDNIIWLVRSGDGVRWEPPVKVLQAPNHQIISPSVVHNAPHAPWVMFAVNSHANGCTSNSNVVERRTSSDGVAWSNPAATDLNQAGQNIWHIDVEWIPSRAEYWAVYNTYASGFSCVTDAVYFARSSDGVRWRTYPSPLIRKGVIPAFRDMVYRSSMLPNALGDSVRLFVSGAKFDGGYQWHTATMARKVSEMLADLGQPPKAPERPNLFHRTLPPPEPDLGPSGSESPLFPSFIKH